MNDNQSGFFFGLTAFDMATPLPAPLAMHTACNLQLLIALLRGFPVGIFPVSWFCLFPFRLQIFVAYFRARFEIAQIHIPYKAYLAHQAFPEYLNHLHLHVLSLCQSGSSSRQAVSSLSLLLSLSISLWICIRICCENKFRRKPFVLFISSNIYTHIYGSEWVCVCECIYYVCAAVCAKAIDVPIIP